VPSLTGGRVNVTLEAMDGSAPWSTFVNLTQAEGTATSYLADTQRIGYGSTGFETFTFDIPERFRGKTATLRFEASGGTVYLDNVFFKSQHLLFGNPSNAGKDLTYDRQDYLSEKSQYAISYNADMKTPNWVSWQLNKDWLGSQRRLSSSYFIPDETLPFRPLVTYEDYRDAGAYDRGHMIASEHRNRDRKDMAATFLMSNILPQHLRNNQFNTAWRNFETYTQGTLVNLSGKELYIIAGGYGTVDALSSVTVGRINIPEYTWKVALVMDRPGMDIQDISKNTNVIALITPNYAEPDTFPRAVNLPDGGKELSFSSLSEWQNWRNWRVSVDYLEKLTGFDFLSNTPKDIQDIIEARDSDPSLVSSLLTEVSFQHLSDISLDQTRTTKSTIVWHDGIAESTAFDNSLTHVSPIQIRVGKVHPLQPATVQDGITQIGVNHLNILQDGILEISTTQVGSPEAYNHDFTIPQISLNKLGLDQVDFLQDRATQIGLAQNSLFQSHIAQSNTLQIRTSQIGSFQATTLDIRSSEIDTKQNSVSQINTSQINPTEIALTSSITLQQFLSSHNYNLQNTTVPTWLSHLTGTTPFNLNIEVTDLPTGQLAEAQLTGFDANGKPNAGTLLLDYNGNDLGWFYCAIAHANANDPTTWENSEFETTLTTTAYRANSTSAAAGRYDLLTTILHELGYLAGIIQGNPAYDRRVSCPLLH
jgi:DNA/RNA endonuclease G (NUC1)